MQSNTTSTFQELMCSICLSAQQNPMRLQKCIHSFCFECISTWLDIKNTCPLCLNFTCLQQKQQYNKLLIKPPEQVQFDQNSLIIQSELQVINQTMKNLSIRIQTKYQQSKNYKNHFPKSSLNYVQDQMLLVKNYYGILQECILINDKVNISMYMQMITEVLLDIENVLNGNARGIAKNNQMHEEYYEDACYDDYDDYNKYDDEEIQEMQEYFYNKHARKEKTNNKKKQQQQNNQQNQQNNQIKSNKVIKS